MGDWKGILMDLVKSDSAHGGFIQSALDELARLEQIEIAAVEVVNNATWSGERFYNKLCYLKSALEAG